MPAFQFRIASAIRRAQPLTHSPGIAVSLPGIRFAGDLLPAEAAVWQLLLLALNQEQVRHYWNGNECCEGCVSNSQPAIHRIESLVRLTRSSLGSHASPVAIVLMSALADGIREFREYIRGFVPDDVRNTPWGEGSRSDYLTAMWALRAHIRNVRRQVMHLLGDSVTLDGVSPTDEEWAPEAYRALRDEQHQ